MCTTRRRAWCPMRWRPAGTWRRRRMGMATTITTITRGMGITTRAIMLMQQEGQAARAMRGRGGAGTGRARRARFPLCGCWGSMRGEGEGEGGTDSFRRSYRMCVLYTAAQICIIDDKCNHCTRRNEIHTSRSNGAAPLALFFIHTTPICPPLTTPSKLREAPAPTTHQPTTTPCATHCIVRRDRFSLHFTTSSHHRVSACLPACLPPGPVARCVS